MVILATFILLVIAFEICPANRYKFEKQYRTLVEKSKADLSNDIQLASAKVREVKLGCLILILLGIRTL